MNEKPDSKPQFCLTVPNLLSDIRRLSEHLWVSPVCRGWGQGKIWQNWHIDSKFSLVKEFYEKNLEIIAKNLKERKQTFLPHLDSTFNKHFSGQLWKATSFHLPWGAANVPCQSASQEPTTLQKPSVKNEQNEGISPWLLFPGTVVIAQDLCRWFSPWCLDKK